MCAAADLADDADGYKPYKGEFFISENLKDSRMSGLFKKKDWMSSYLETEAGTPDKENGPTHEPWQLDAEKIWNDDSKLKDPFTRPWYFAQKMMQTVDRGSETYYKNPRNGDKKWVTEIFKTVSGMGPLHDWGRKANEEEFKGKYPSEGHTSAP